jgi:hypothetical protein
MKWLINDIDANGEVTTEAEKEERSVPDFEVSNGRDELATGE